MRALAFPAALLLAVTLVGTGCNKETGGDVNVSQTTVPAVGEGPVTIKGTAFNPKEVRIKVGQTVAWTNQDDFGHTSTGDNKEWNSQTIAPKTMFVLRINKAGTYTYHCEIHKQMKATVVVE